MQVIFYTPKLLLEFIDSEEYNTMPEIPISKHRAISHCNNPRVKEDDIILICIYDEGKMIGYLGILADDIFINNTTIHLGWMSCIWIDTAQRGKGIAKTLLQYAIEKWQGNIIATEFTETARRVYMRSGYFQNWQIQNGCRLFFRMPSAYILPPKNALLQKLKPLWKIADKAFNSLADMRLSLRNKEIKNISFEYLLRIDDEAAQYISANNESNYCRRAQKELNWITDFPWILQAPEKDNFGKKYAFTATEKIFANCILKVKNPEGKIIGLMWLVRRNHFLKIPYMYFEKDDLSKLILLLYRQLIAWKISVLTVYNPEIAAYILKNPSPALYKKQISREYLASKTIVAALKAANKNLQDGDGDCAFT